MSGAPFTCIGCGATNPPGAEDCSGCGHRFAGAGPIPGPPPRPVAFKLPPPLPDPPPPRESSGIVRVLGWLGLAAAMGLATSIAFLVTCTSAFLHEAVRDPSLEPDWPYLRALGYAALAGIPIGAVAYLIRIIARDGTPSSQGKRR